MTVFTPINSSQIRELIEAYPLCWIVSGGTDDRHATPLPLLPEIDGDGKLTALFGHIARSNPQYPALDEKPRASILCMGPQGYISPQLVANPTWGPTWNYAVCRFEVIIQFVPEETEAAVWRLAAALEGQDSGSWTPERMGERYHELKHRIIAFRAHITETHARFKLGQDESEETFKDIVTELPDQTLADWMRWTRP